MEASSIFPNFNDLVEKDIPEGSVKVTMRSGGMSFLQVKVPGGSWETVEFGRKPYDDESLRTYLIHTPGPSFNKLPGMEKIYSMVHPNGEFAYTVRDPASRGYFIPPEPKPEPDVQAAIETLASAASESKNTTPDLLRSIIEALLDLPKEG